MSGLTREKVIEILGPLTDEHVAKIIATGASEDEVVEAGAWLNQEDYMAAGLHRPLTGRVATVFDIITSSELEPEEREP